MSGLLISVCPEPGIVAGGQQVSRIRSRDGKSLGGAAEGPSHELDGRPYTCLALYKETFTGIFVCLFVCLNDGEKGEMQSL